MGAETKIRGKKTLDKLTEFEDRANGGGLRTARALEHC